MNEVLCVQQANAILGEGPSWCSVRQVLYWVDIERPAVFRYDPERGQTGRWPMPSTVGCAVPTKEGELLFADDDGFGILSLETGATRAVAVVEGHLPGNRFNDGKVDSRGRFWAGSVDREFRHPTGSLYRMDPDYSVSRIETGMICSNGLGWSPDDRIMYFTDSVARKIWSYDFNVEDGTIRNRRVFAEFSEDDGMPDGLTVDAAGFVWSAIWDGWRVIRFSPLGLIDQVIHMPVQRPSSCTFGGPDLKTLYITSASIDLPFNAVKGGPLAGALFAVQVEVPGLDQTPFGG